MKSIEKTLLCVALSAALSGCKPSSSLPSWTNPSPSPAPAGPAAPSLATVPQRAALDDEADTFTILLSFYNDPASHIEHAEYAKKALAEHLGWKDLFVINKEGWSELYWGRYNTPDKAAGNLAKAKAHKAQTGVYPFAAAMIVPLPGNDVGPSQWNLKNAKGVYTLLVAVFQNVPDKNYYQRRTNAVQTCRQLRQEGHEAYFYHGPTVSHVTVGMFGEKAVEYSVVNGVEQANVVDPRVAAFRKTFPNMAVNGRTETELIGADYQTRQRLTATKESQLIVVPGKKVRGVAEEWAAPRMSFE